MNGKIFRRIISILLKIIMLICFCYIIWYFKGAYIHKEEKENLSIRKESTTQLQSTAQSDAESFETESAAEKSTTQILDETQTNIHKNYIDLYEENNDLVGWLHIKGTNIDYPVMQTEDNEYYLNHNFKKQEDQYGCLFVKDNVDIWTPSTNFIIYGHNMNDGAMFGDLDKYESKSYYEQHSIINFDTLNEERKYKIISVFLSQVYESEADTFKYYEFYQADTKEEFEAFYNNIKMLSLYDTEARADYGDTLITLSTCAYHVENGRLVIVGKRIK